MMRKKTCFFILTLILCMALGLSIAEEAGISEIRQKWQKDESSICFPLLEGGTAAVEAINRAMSERTSIEAYKALLNNLTSGGIGLTIDYESALGERYYSVAISVSGKMLQGRPGQKYYAMTFDLSTGEAVPFEALFTDSEAALSLIEGRMEGEVSDILSTYMDNAELLPVPTDCFALVNHTLTFYYDNEQLSFLSGDAGAVAFEYYELSPYLRLDADSPAGDLLAFSETDDAVERLRRLAESGTIFEETSDTPLCAIGQQLEEVLNKLRQSADSSYYPNGRYIETEHPAMRGTYLLTDEDETELVGLMTKRHAFCGLIPEQTQRSEWQSLLGVPDASVTLDSEPAEAYLLTFGVSDSYRCGAYTLTLHANENGILEAIILKK